jgi:hypothetical protein
MSSASLTPPPAMSLPGRHTVVVGSVLLMHGVALWALHQGLLRPPVELIVPAQVLAEFITPQPAPPPPAPPPPEPPKPTPAAVKPAPRPTPRPRPVHRATLALCARQARRRGRGHVVQRPDQFCSGVNQVMQSQFGLINVWTQGDWVTRSVLLLLLGMSLASWMVILIKALDLRKFSARPGGPKLLARQRLCRRHEQAGHDPTNPFRRWPWKAAKPPPHPAQGRQPPKPQLHDSWT